MPLEIIGRLGATNHVLAIDSQGRAQVASASESEDRHINQTSGNVWSLNYEALLINANVYGLYIKNIGPTNQHITDLRNHAIDAATEVRMDLVTGVVAGGTPVTDIQTRNPGSSAADPVITIEYATAATGLTGLTKANTIFNCGSLDNKTSHLKTSSNIILGPSQAIAILFKTANAINGITGTISLVEITHES